MKYRHHGSEQVAIGFPRRYIQSLGLTPVWYLKHNPGIRHVLAALKTRDLNAFRELSPFIDENDDVAPFQEVRTTSPVNIEQAVWILTTNRIIDPPRLQIPNIDTFQAVHGAIPKSYWHRSHQLEILSEWQFIALTKNDHGVPKKFEFIGEYYWRHNIAEEKELSVTFPAHQKEIIFEVTRPEKHEQYNGPWRFIDVARFIARTLLVAGECIDEALPYRLIEDLTNI